MTNPTSNPADAVRTWIDEAAKERNHAPDDIVGYTLDGDTLCGECTVRRYSHDGLLDLGSWDADSAETWLDACARWLGLDRSDEQSWEGLEFPKPILRCDRSGPCADCGAGLPDAAYACPDCGCEDLYVYPTGRVLLKQDKHGFVGHGPVEDLYWDENSPASCASPKCDWSGTVSDTELDDGLE